MRFLIAIALAIALGAGSAAAQLASSATGVILRNQHVDDLFTPVADATQFVARHNLSRLVCRFGAPASPNFTVYNSGVPRGDDVSCVQNNGRQTVTFYATRYPQPMTLASAIQEITGEITTVSPQAQPAESPNADPMAPFESATRAFIIPNAFGTHDTIYSRASVVVSDGWVYLMRFSASVTEPLPEQQAQAVWRQFEIDLASQTESPKAP